MGCKSGIGLLYSGAAMGALLFLSVFFGGLMRTALHINFTIDLTIMQQAAGSILIWVTSLWQISFLPSAGPEAGKYSHAADSCGSGGNPGYFGFVKALVLDLSPGSDLPADVHGFKSTSYGLPAVEGQMTYTPSLIGWHHVAIGQCPLLFGCFFSGSGEESFMKGR